jgi:hypothetical protein
LKPITVGTSPLVAPLAKRLWAGQKNLGFSMAYHGVMGNGH